MDQCLFVPCHDLMAKLAHDLEHADAQAAHALGEIDSPRNRGHLKMEEGARSHYDGKTALGRDAGQKDFRVQLTNLSFHWNNESRC